MPNPIAINKQQLINSDGKKLGTSGTKENTKDENHLLIMKNEIKLKINKSKW